MQSNRNIKILLVIPSLSGGGAEKLFVDLLKHIDIERFDVHVCLFTHEIDYYLNLPKDIHFVYFRKRHKIDFFLIILRLIKVINKERFSCVHTWLLYANLLGIFAKLIVNLVYKYDFRLIISTHNDYVEKFRAMGIKGILCGWLVRVFFNKADHITSISNTAACGLIRKYYLKKQKVRVIYNGVDLDEIKKRSHEPITECEWFGDKKAQIIVSVGALSSHQKDFRNLLYAFESIAFKHPNARLVIIGKGPERLNLELLSQRLGIIPRVKFLGFQTNPYKFMRNATVFVLSTLYEGLPIVILEAMATRTPVIITNVSVANELILDGEDGLVVPTGEPESLAKAISVLLMHSDLRTKISIKCFETVSSKFNLNSMLKKYQELY